MVERLAFHHRDPFDRLLIAQATSEGIPSGPLLSFPLSPFLRDSALSA